MNTTPLFLYDYITISSALPLLHTLLCPGNNAPVPAGPLLRLLLLPSCISSLGGEANEGEGEEPGDAGDEEGWEVWLLLLLLVTRAGCICIALPGAEAGAGVVIAIPVPAAMPA